MKEKKEMLSVYGSDVMVTRSNEFIRSKYKATLLESKLLVLAISRLQNEEFSHNKDLVVSFSAAELKMILNEEDKKSIYHKLRYCAESLVQNFFVFQDKKGDFKVSVIIKDCEYKDGIFTVEFNNSIKEHIFKLTNNYTPMKLSILLAFSKGRTNSSYRVYEVLRTHMFKIRGLQNSTTVTYNLYDFMLYTGQIDVNDNKIMSAIRDGKSTEYIVNNIVTKGKNAKNIVWGDYKRRILDPAIEEINEISDIIVNYKVIKGGKGGKVRALEFKIAKKDDYHTPLIDSFNVTPDMLIEFESIVSEPMSTQEKVSIIKMATGNFSRIEKIYKMALAQPEVNNLAAWMVAGLREEWDLEKDGDIHLVRGEYAGEYQRYVDEVNEVLDADFEEL